MDPLALPGPGDGAHLPSRLILIGKRPSVCKPASRILPRSAQTCKHGAGPARGCSNWVMWSLPMIGGSSHAAAATLTAVAASTHVGVRPSYAKRRLLVCCQWTMQQCRIGRLTLALHDCTPSKPTVGAVTFLGGLPWAGTSRCLSIGREAIL